MSFNCLFLSTFTDKDLEIKEIIKSSLYKNGIDLLHPSDVSFDTPLMEVIQNLLDTTSFIIADISTLNPNVFYEIGLAHAQGRQIILICDINTDLPISFSNYPIIRYDREKLQSETLLEKIYSNLKTLDLLPKRKRKDRSHEIVKKKIDFDNPFNSLFAESMDQNILQMLFVVPPYFNDIINADTSLFVGPRGCGKTTLLLNMSIRNSIDSKRNDIDCLSFGTYLNFNTSFHFMDSQQNIITDINKVISYFNLLYLNSLLNDFDYLFKNNRINNSDQRNIIAIITDLLKIKDAHVYSLAKITKLISEYTQVIKSGKNLDDNLMDQLSDKNFLDELCHKLLHEFNFFINAKISFLLDDYANDWLPEEICRILNIIIFKRSNNYNFKIATIPGRLNLTIDTRSNLEITHDYRLISIASNNYFSNSNHRVKFIQQIINKRLIASGSNLDAKEILNPSNKTKYGIDYSGIKNLSQLCISDFRTILILCRNMLLQWDTYYKPIPRDIQNKVVIDYSSELIENLRQSFEWGEYAYKFLTEYVNFIKSIPDKFEQYKFSSLKLKITEAISSDSEIKLQWLIRSGIIQTSDDFYSKQTFYFSRIYFPHFKLPILKYRNILYLRPKELDILFDNPKSFWEHKLKQLILQ